MSAKINAERPSGDENCAGSNNCPLIPVRSCVPTLAIEIVNGTFLSPGPTSIFPEDVPKYASRNFILIIAFRMTPSGQPTQDVASLKASGISGLTTNAIIKTMVIELMPVPPSVALRLQMNDRLLS